VQVLPGRREDGADCQERFVKKILPVGLFALGLAVAALAIPPRSTEGTLEFCVTTVTTKGKYAPRHVVAIWVADARGRFVKTLRLAGRKQSKRLRRWARASRKNVVDAVTGATMKKHGTHTVAWDGRDAKGRIVPDGMYQVRVEFTEKNRLGPVTPLGHVRFVKGRLGATARVSDLPNFKKMSVTWTPAGGVAKK
jgi:hypothetical protein